MSEPVPAKDRRINTAHQVNGLLNHYISVLDAKASAFLAGNVASATLLLRGVPDLMCLEILYYVALACYGASVLMAGATIFPRLPRTGDSVLFWGDIAACKDAQIYTERFDKVVDGGKLDEQYLAQNFLTARVLARKYRCLRTCIALFFLALFYIKH